MIVSIESKMSDGKTHLNSFYKDSTWFKYFIGQYKRRWKSESMEIFIHGVFATRISPESDSAIFINCKFVSLQNQTYPL